jgi:hypothetical protein
MKLISLEAGRAVNLIVMEEVRPLHGISLRDFIEAIAERYQFSSVPDPKVAATSSQPTTFKNGEIELNGDKIIIDDLTIYSDGIGVETKHTDKAALVLEDGVAWFSRSFNLRAPMTPVKRAYSSTVIVEFDNPVEQSLKNWNAIQSLLKDAIKKREADDSGLSLTRIVFSTDPTIPREGYTSTFQLERRADVPYARNRYFCVAPLDTESHLAYLTALDALLA